MDDGDRRELERLRQLMDMNVYVSDEGHLRCNFAFCSCGDSVLDLPVRRTTLFDVAEAIMEHRVDNLFTGSRVVGRSEP